MTPSRRSDARATDLRLRGTNVDALFCRGVILQKRFAERQLRDQAGMLVLLKTRPESRLAMADESLPRSIGNRQAFQHSQSTRLAFLLVFDVQLLQLSIDVVCQSLTHLDNRNVCPLQMQPIVRGVAPDRRQSEVMIRNGWFDPV